MLCIYDAFSVVVVIASLRVIFELKILHMTIFTVTFCGCVINFGSIGKNISILQMQLCRKISNIMFGHLN